ncbi:MAG: hypothetical protein IT297_01260, partial [Anaerolineae bacterium]|nr:hypothetical protein [Anaerolineae bacterium]
AEVVPITPGQEIIKFMPTDRVSPVVAAVKVDKVPIIDANWKKPSYKEGAWKDVPFTRIGGQAWRAIYDDTTLSILIEVPRPLELDDNGNYAWDPATKTWSQRETGSQSEFFVMGWDMMPEDPSNTGVTAQACNSFCHESATDLSKEIVPVDGMHHQAAPGSTDKVDTWVLTGKHGFPGASRVDYTPEMKAQYGLQKFQEDRFHLVGSISAQQNSDSLIFNTLNELNPRAVLGGSATFVGYAEDAVISVVGDPDFPRDRARDQYCTGCHQAIDFPYDPLDLDATYPDVGDVFYEGNWVMPYTAPKYMEIKPTDFIDAMTLSQEEVDNGEAVLVADLTPAQISEYWANYDAVNGTVPSLNYKGLPSGSMADVMQAMDWTNGIATIEIQRALVTGHPEEDVQFDDLNHDYGFGVAISGGYVSPFLNASPGFLRFMP